MNKFETKPPIKHVTETEKLLYIEGSRPSTPQEDKVREKAISWSRVRN